MVPEVGVWLIFLAPLGAFLAIVSIIRPFLNRYTTLSSGLLIVALAVSFGLSIWTLSSVISNGPLNFEPHTWLSIKGLDIRVGLLVDPLTAIMLIIVTGVSLLVQIYSVGYMTHDPSYSRYFAFMGLFSASMLGLVLASNILQMYLMWELVGLGSYLLIGFWHQKPEAAAAAKKAFLVTRIGDFGFLLAILYLFFNKQSFLEQGLNPLEIADIQAAIPMIKSGVIASISGIGLTWIGLGIFAGAAGKSAQFPLHVWLPDAMEGPTPVSALIHAATMVAAGVFLVARFFPIFEASEVSMTTIALIGTFTAIFAATMAVVMNDIKRVLAYSTISQLGFMMASLGIGAYGASIFLLFNHAFFKSLLFLGAGSVSHATGTFDMRKMGGLNKIMPVTYIATIIGSLSLVGIFPLSGFWSKEEILGHALHGNSFNASIFWILMVGSLLTAWYTIRMVYLTFHGTFRGKVQSAHLTESTGFMLAPMIILAILAIGSGYIVNPQYHIMGIPSHWFSLFIRPASLHSAIVPINWWLAIGVTASTIATIALTVRVYSKASQVPKVLHWPHYLATQKYYIDRVYERTIVAKLLYRSIGTLLEWLDQQIVDNTVDTIGWISRNIGRVIGKSQTGQAQTYGIFLSLGLVVILISYIWWG